MEETPLLRQVLKELGPGFIRWQPLGIHLEIDPNELDAIRVNEHDVLNQTIMMLERWYANTTPTWGALCQALRGIGHPSLADRISVQYCRVPQQEVQQPTSAAPSVREPSKGDGGQQPDTPNRPRPPIPDGEVTGTHPPTSNESPHPPRQDRGNEQHQATASQQPLGLPPSLEDSTEQQTLLPILEDTGISPALDVCALDDEERYETSLEFAFMFVTVVQLLNEILDVDALKSFLDSFRNSFTQQPYVDSRLYERCETTEAVLKSLHPHYINPMNTYLLRKIVLKFGNDEAKQRLEEYDRNFPQSLPIKRLGSPLTDEEMADCPSAKRVKVVKDGDASRITKREVEEVQEALARSTGTDPKAIIFARLSNS